jgi:arylsulfatase A-like enzyme
MRAIYAVEAKDSPQYGQINPASLMIVKDGYKLTYYTGWDRQKDKDPFIELYAIKEDPEEMNNLAKQLPDLKKDLLEELLTRTEQANQQSMR